MTGTTQINITKFHGNSYDKTNDFITLEEPLEIKLVYYTEGKRNSKSLSVTMRTPGNDVELVTGFLYTEGLIKSYADLENIDEGFAGSNSVTATLHSEILFDLSKLDRHFYTSSSCGVCGKTSIESVNTVIPESVKSNPAWEINPEIIYRLPEKLRAAQSVFETTGGLHASALFDLEGNLISLKEDVGRHNALDKIIGNALQQNIDPLANHILLLSGRASFELIQKAAMAGIKMVLAVGAPSNLAVKMAEDAGITLIGFLRDNRFNLYSNPQRVKFVQ